MHSLLFQPAGRKHWGLISADLKQRWNIRIPAQKLKDELAWVVSPFIRNTISDYSCLSDRPEGGPRQTRR